MTLDQFVNISTGKAVSYDGLKENIGQCEQLVCCYWRDCLGFLCPPIGAAKDLWTNPTVLQHFLQIPVGREQKGDVAVWGASPLINSPEFGHTDAVLSPGFLGFDSNWGGYRDANGNPAAHQVQHNYSDVLGFLRWKGGNMPTLLTDPITEEVFVTILHRQPAQADLDAWRGQDIMKCVDELYHSKEWAIQDEALKNPPQANATKLGPGLYDFQA